MTQPARPPVGPVIAAVVVGVWAVGLTVCVQVLGWGLDQVLLVLGVDRPGWVWPVVSLVTALLVGGPAALVAYLPRAATVRAAGRAWLAGASALAGLGALRTVPGSQPEAYLALLALVAAALGYAWRRRPEPVGDADAGPAGLPHPTVPHPALGHPVLGGAVAVGLLVLLPWLWVGALGGAVETACAVAAAAALGWLAASILDPPFWRAFAAAGSPTRQVLVGGLVAGVALVLVAGGAGASGAQLPLLLVLPPLGFVAAALAGSGRRWPVAAPVGTAALAGSGRRWPVAAPVGTAALAGSGRRWPVAALVGTAALAGSGRRWPVAALVGTAALGPLGFVDPEEVTLLLPGRDVPFWAGIAAGASLVLALLVGLGFWLVPLWSRHRAARSFPSLSPDPGRPARRWVSTALAGALVLVAGAVHVGLGQPGLHGERLFVIMAEQADLSGLPTGTGQPGRDARAAEVYRRLVAHADATQGDLRADLDRVGFAYTPYYLVNAVEVAGGPEVRAWLSGRADVDRVLTAQRLRPLPAAGRPASGEPGLVPSDPEWSVAMTGADRVWSELGVTGVGIVVGSSDSGVDGAHPALADGFRGGDDSWLDPWNGTTEPTDRGGHGTHTLGSAVGRGGIGVAPGAAWSACVNLDRNLGNPPHYLDCLQFMLAPYPAGGDPFRDGRPDRAPHVLTNSWACPPIEGCDATALRPATAALHAAGIYLVVAAGNAGPLCESIREPPAPHPDVLTVGAVDRLERVADFSSRGPTGADPKPDLVAPGRNVVSAMPGGGYAPMSGTSMATPHVAGVVALMWSAAPALIGEVETTTAILAGTARPVPEPAEPACGGMAALAGAGLVDAPAAVRAAIRSTE